MALHFTADLHLFHKKAVEFRGFNCSDGMHDILRSKWNKKVHPNDTVYILGDLSFGKPLDTLKLLESFNGKKCLIRGNHDNTKYIKAYAASGMFEWIEHYYELKHVFADGTKKDIIMSHFPMLSWNKSHYGSWHLHGHCHGYLRAPETTRLDIGVDTNNLEVYSMDDITEIMKNRKYIAYDHHTEVEQ
ncbi:hypothetical protein [Ralstonia phage RP13]|nr:hypothetical protein [Ralstonia phage RP13]